MLGQQPEGDRFDWEDVTWQNPTTTAPSGCYRPA